MLFSPLKVSVLFKLATINLENSQFFLLKHSNSFELPQNMHSSFLGCNSISCLNIGTFTVILKHLRQVYFQGLNWLKCRSVFVLQLPHSIGVFILNYKSLQFFIFIHKISCLSLVLYANFKILYLLAIVINSR